MQRARALITTAQTTHRFTLVSTSRLTRSIPAKFHNIPKRPFHTSARQCAVGPWPWLIVSTAARKVMKIGAAILGRYAAFATVLSAHSDSAIVSSQGIS